MSDVELLERMGTDGMKWAEEFCRIINEDALASES